METIYLDTHIVVWLYYGFIEKLSKRAVNLINKSDLLIFPIVLLEMQFLYEINKISNKPEEIYDTLNKEIGIKICKRNFEDIINYAITLLFTIDPFDRIIVAQADINNNKLITKDKKIKNNFNVAVW